MSDEEKEIVDLGDEEKMLTDLEKHIEEVWQQMYCSASYASGGSNLSDHRIQEIVSELQDWSSDVSSWLEERKLFARVHEEKKE